MHRLRLFLATVLAFTPGVVVGVDARQSSAPAPRVGQASVEANDNRRSAGTLAGGVLTLRLVAEQGEWRPEGPAGRTLTVQAFREESGSLTAPGPLVRVPAGTEIHASIRNAVPGTTLRVFGMGTRPLPATSAPVEVPAGQTRDVRFLAGDPGTYHYWATTTNQALAQRRDLEGQLGGALVIDPPGTATDDRVMVIGLWRKPDSPPGEVVEIGAINGRSWPLTEKFDYRVGDRVRWRVVNLSFDSHAMHLHGMYFKVLSNGDGRTSRAFADGEQPMVVTEHAVPGETFEILWTPERPGNWLFHCHMLVHMTPGAGSPVAADHEHATGPSGGMAGLVLGIRVSGAPVSAPSAREPRHVAMRLREEPNRYGNRPGYRVDVEGTDISRVSSGSLPGPAIILTRGEPVAIDIANEMRDPTAIHWHGIELDSYYDGVPGWGGTVGSTTPEIQAGQRFTARFTPPRAGTFIYHTHSHNEGQLSGGLYGALIVLEPGQRFNPATDHVFIAGYDGPEVPGRSREPIVINGRVVTVPASSPGPEPKTLRPNVPNRIRLINITPNNVALTFVLTDGVVPVSWIARAKDGADLPLPQQRGREARQLVSVGETFDFEITPAPGQRLWLELRRGSGEWVAQELLVAAPQ